MEILLLRHGETHWNFEKRCQGLTDLKLNETGLGQARDVAAHLRKVKVHAVYSSNLKRAIQTANMISEFHGLEVITDSDFRELNHGEFEGLTFTEIQATYPDFIQAWREKPAHLAIPGGESIADVGKRAWRGIENIKRHYLHKTVVIVSHQFPMVSILCRITGTPLNNYRSFHVDPCGLSRISYSKKQGWKLTQANDRSFVNPPTA